MKKYTALLSFVICLFFNVKAQIIDTIENVKTFNHIEIPGTKYLLIKPDTSFAIATDYPGLKNKDLEAGLNISELPMPLSEILPMFTKDLPPKNGKLLLEKDLIMNSYKAKLYKTEVIPTSLINQSSNQEKERKSIVMWLLIYGDENICFTINATYPSSKDNELSDKFEKSLLSFIYLKDKEVNPLEGLTFKMDLSNTPLKFATLFMQTGAVFNMDGKYPSEAADITNYKVMMMPFGAEGEEQKEMAIGAVKNKYEENVEIKEINAITLDGLSGYEVIGYEKQAEKQEILKYAVTLFDTGRSFTITGISETDNLEMFRKITRTFRLNK